MSNDTTCARTNQHATVYRHVVYGVLLNSLVSVFVSSVELIDTTSYKVTTRDGIGLSVGCVSTSLTRLDMSD